MQLVWNELGIIPPVSPGQVGNSPDRSPYIVPMDGFVDMFSLSDHRNRLLVKFLEYRNLWYQAGIHQGFQWIDGSFMENIELLEDRGPKDIDVVTFASIPAAISQETPPEACGLLFDHAHCKHRYHVDAYFVQTGNVVNEYTIKLVSYWYSVWSHRRDNTWKGFIQIPLDKHLDGEVLSRLQDDNREEYGNELS